MDYTHKLIDQFISEQNCLPELFKHRSLNLHDVQSVSLIRNKTKLFITEFLETGLCDSTFFQCKVRSLRSHMLFLHSASMLLFESQNKAFIPVGIACPWNGCTIGNYAFSGFPNKLWELFVQTVEHEYLLFWPSNECTEVRTWVQHIWTCSPTDTLKERCQ